MRPRLRRSISLQYYRDEGFESADIVTDSASRNRLPETTHFSRETCGLESLQIQVKGSHSGSLCSKERGVDPQAHGTNFDRAIDGGALRYREVMVHVEHSVLQAMQSFMRGHVGGFVVIDSDSG